MTLDYTPRGLRATPVDPDRCRAEVLGTSAWDPYRQCSRKHLSGERYCRQHHPDMVADRRRMQRERWDREQEIAKVKARIIALGTVAWNAGIRTEDELAARLH